MLSEDFGVEIVFELVDLEELHERLRGLGVDLTPPEQRSWGLQDFRVLDPEGYYLRFTTPPPAAPGMP